MGLRARFTAVALILVGAVLGPVSAADAASLPPVQAPLLNAAGEPSGCTLRAGAPYQFMAHDGLREGWGLTLTCTTAWSRIRLSAASVEVLPDGTTQPGIPGGGLLIVGNTETGAQTLRTNWLCSDTPGTHKYRYRATATVKTGLHDTNVFSAKVARVASFTCPG